MICWLRLGEEAEGLRGDSKGVENGKMLCLIPVKLNWIAAGTESSLALYRVLGI
jgi:hypothetical protein